VRRRAHDARSCPQCRARRGRLFAAELFDSMRGPLNYPCHPHLVDQFLGRVFEGCLFRTCYDRSLRTAWAEMDWNAANPVPMPRLAEFEDLMAILASVARDRGIPPGPVSGGEG
jgi:hypothetical protein